MIKAKYIDLSKVLEKAVEAGKWQDRLPGVFRLAKEYNVDPATVSKALRLLEKKGIVTINGRRGTFISKHETRPAHKVIGVVGASEEDSVTCHDLRIIKEYFKNLSYEVIAISQNDDLLRSNPQFWAKLPIDGLIFMYSTLTRELISELRQSGMPFVSANKIIGLPGISWVDFGGTDALAELIHYFYKLGHRRIAFADIKHNKNNFTERLRKVYCDTCAKLNCLDEELFYVSDKTETLADDFLDMDSGATTIISLSYSIAKSFKKAAEVRNLKIPGDLSLASYKGEEHDDFFTISYYQRDKRAKMAGELLWEKIKSPDSKVKQITLENKLIPGKSSARIN